MITKNNFKVLMVDALVGSDYSIFLCSALESKGVDISLVMTEDRNNILNKYKFPIIPLSPSKSKDKNKVLKIFKYFRYLWSLYFIIKKEKMKIIHFQFFRRIRMESIYFLVLKALGYNVVYTVHDVTPLDQNKVDQFFISLVYKAANKLFVHSATNRKALQKFVKKNQQKIEVVPHGDYADFLHTDMKDKEYIREDFDLNESDNVILFFGFIKEYKGLDLLLDSILTVSEKVNNLVVIIAGNVETNELKARYEKKIAELSSKVRIIYKFEFIPLNEVYKYFLSADLVALPYKRISHSGILHMVLLFGKPAVATKVGDFEEMIVEGKSGLFSKSQDSKDFSDVLIKAFSDKQALEAMGQYAKELGQTKYSWDNSATLLKSIYQNL